MIGSSQRRHDWARATAATMRSTPSPSVILSREACPERSRRDGEGSGTLPTSGSFASLRMTPALLTHGFRIHTAISTELDVRERRDLARLDLAAAAPEYVRVQHRNAHAGEVLVD